MARDRNLLIVIADGEHARFVRPAADNALHTQEELRSTAAHKRSSDLGADHPGASFHTDSSAHHGVAPRHDPHVLEMERFAREVAQRLNAGAVDGSFDELLVIAPPHILSTILDAMDPAAVAKVIGSLRKDLIKTPDAELRPHLSEWVPPIRRVAT